MIRNLIPLWVTSTGAGRFIFTVAAVVIRQSVVTCREGDNLGEQSLYFFPLSHGFVINCLSIVNSGRNGKLHPIERYSEFKGVARDSGELATEEAQCCEQE